MDEGLIKAIALGLGRDGAKLAAGWLVAHGLLAGGSDTQWVAGAILGLIGVGFSLYDKYVVKAKLAAK